jgi:hypothetical protein
MKENLEKSIQVSETRNELQDLSEEFKVWQLFSNFDQETSDEFDKFMHEKLIKQTA